MRSTYLVDSDALWGSSISNAEGTILSPPPHPCVGPCRNSCPLRDRACLTLCCMPHSVLPAAWGVSALVWVSREANWAQFIWGVMPGNSARGAGKWAKEGNNTNVECPTQSYWDPQETLENTPQTWPPKRQRNWGDDSPTAFSHCLMPAPQRFWPACMHSAGKRLRHLKSSPLCAEEWVGPEGYGWDPMAYAKVRFRKWTCACLVHSLSNSTSCSWPAFFCFVHFAQEGRPCSKGEVCLQPAMYTEFSRGK